MPPLAIHQRNPCERSRRCAIYCYRVGYIGSLKTATGKSSDFTIATIVLRAHYVNYTGGLKMTYVDAFVVSVPKDKVESYRAMLSESATLWKEFGALSYVESVADDVP